jgi:hypothetical protein
MLMLRTTLPLEFFVACPLRWGFGETLPQWPPRCQVIPESSPVFGHMNQLPKRIGLRYTFSLLRLLVIANQESISPGYFLVISSALEIEGGGVWPTPE